MARRFDFSAPHTQVHRLSRHLLEPAQDILVTEIAWPQLVALTLFILALGALLRYGGLRSVDAGEPNGDPGDTGAPPEMAG